jgi:putative DNA primase/helicase
VYGLAIVGGQVSGNLEILDLDTYDLIEPFRREVERQVPGLFEHLVRVQTPRPGMHLYYRCSKIAGSQKLAMIPDPESERPKPKTIVETKGEGGYCLAPPSPDWCHPKEKCYIFVGDKDLTQIPTITPDERQALFAAAKTLNRWQHARPKPKRTTNRKSHHRRGSLRPGDDFNERAEWADILKPHGWTYDGQGGDGTDRWTRPGKAEGCSATTNYAGSDVLYVWSRNADPFDDEEAYTKFHAFALLECDGDFHEAAVELRRRGYGKSSKPSRKRRSTRRRSRTRRSGRRLC